MWRTGCGTGVPRAPTQRSDSTDSWIGLRARIATPGGYTKTGRSEAWAKARKAGNRAPREDQMVHGTRAQTLDGILPMGHLVEAAQGWAGRRAGAGRAAANAQPDAKNHGRPCCSHAPDRRPRPGALPEKSPIARGAHHHHHCLPIVPREAHRPPVRVLHGRAAFLSDSRVPGERKTRDQGPGLLRVSPSRTADSVTAFSSGL